MSTETKITVSFPCDDVTGTALLAQEHMKRLGFEPWDRQDERSHQGGKSLYDARCMYAIMFLNDVAAAPEVHCSKNGGMLCWGTRSNGVLAKDFIESLRPFFLDLLGAGEGGEIQGGPDESDRILILTQPEQTETMHAWELFRPWSNAEPCEHVGLHERTLSVRHSVIPISWEPLFSGSDA